MPHDSILMTVYNGMPHLPLAVESALAQTLRDFRFVIVNDGSTDGTADYLNQLTDPRVLVLHQSNQGTAAAANFGLSHCGTEFTARMDADDVSLPTRLETQLAFLRAHPEVGLVGTQVAPLGSAGAGRSLQLPLTHDEIYTALLAGRHGLAHSSIMFRTALLRDLGGYWSLPLVDDWDMMLRMGEAAKLANLDQVLHHYRVHGGSLNGSGMRRMRLSIDYACELARGRRAGLRPVPLDKFRALRDKRPWWQRGWDALHTYALAQYRVAVADLYGGRPLRGRLRLAWAAICGPSLTWQRIKRMARRIGRGGSDAASHVKTSSIASSIGN
jgi:glycosyltransferase involved in cell wall biosynthesis